MHLQRFSSSSSHRTSRWLWVLFLTALIIFAALFILSWQHSQNLQTRLPAVEGIIASINPTPVSNAKLQADCTTQKQAHITECGDGFPEDDYRCRTTEAEAVLQTCLENTKDGNLETVQP